MCPVLEQRTGKNAAPLWQPVFRAAGRVRTTGFKPTGTQIGKSDLRETRSCQTWSPRSQRSRHSVQIRRRSCWRQRKFWSAANGILVKMDWRPHASSPVEPSITNGVWRRPAPFTTNSVSLRNKSPVPRAGRTAESNKARLVILRPSTGVFSILRRSRRIERCRIGPDSICSAEHLHITVAARCAQHHVDRDRFTRTRVESGGRLGRKS